MVTTALPSAAQDIGGVDLIAVTVGAYTVAVAMTFPVAGAVIDREGVGRASRSRARCSRSQTSRRPRADDAGRRPVAADPGLRRRVHVRRPARPLRRLDPRRAAAAGIRHQRGDVGRLGADRAGSAPCSPPTVGWRWVFWINLPMIATVAWAARAARCAVRPAPGRRTRPPLNLVGPVLLGRVVAVLLAAHPALAAAARSAAAGAVPAAASSSTSAGRRSPSSPTPPTRSPPTSRLSGGRGVPRRRDLPAAPAPGGVRTDAPASASRAPRRHRAPPLHARMDDRLDDRGADGARPRNQIALGTSLTVAATFVMAIPAGGAALPIAAYTLSGLGMGIASPALFAAVLADGAEGREGRSTSSIPLARQVGPAWAPRSPASSSPRR